MANVMACDVAHIQTYAVPLIADAGGANWRRVARATLNLDREPESARRVWTSHLVGNHQCQ
ncbi:DUF2285 domain-containing protein [Mesorhizobium ciceri]|uniref:DUF2285 domain-containing protein n=1 Tax=Mesorhizobium ciceri TaxID=39645 RepID=UPI0034502E40